MKEVFFSYAWNDSEAKGENLEKIVDELYHSLKSQGYQVIRDNYDLGYKEFISDFMERIGRGRNIVVAISKKYLRSPFCMFELFEISRNSGFDKEKFSEKVIPVMLEFVDFNNPEVLNEFLAYWEAEYKKWDQLVKDKSGSLSVEQFQRYDKIKMVWQHFGKLADWLIDMNTLNPVLLSANNFEVIRSEIESGSAVEFSGIDEEKETGKAVSRTNSGGIKYKQLLLWLSALVLLILGYMLLNNPSKPVSQTQSVSVFVHGKKGLQDMILRKQGYVIMDLKGGERKKADINENGVAYFQNLQVGDTVRIEVDFSEPYKSLVPDSLFIVNADGRFYLPVVLEGIGVITGRVMYRDEALPGVDVSVDNFRTQSDSLGRFRIDVPESAQRKQYTVWFNRKGFKIKSAPAFPQTGEELVIIMEK